MKKDAKKSIKEFKNVEIKKANTTKVKGGNGPATEDSLDI